MKKILSILLALTMIIPSIAYATEQESLKVQGETELVGVEKHSLNEELGDADINIRSTSEIYHEVTGRRVLETRGVNSQSVEVIGDYTIYRSYIQDEETKENVAYLYKVLNKHGEVMGRGNSIKVKFEADTLERVATSFSDRGWAEVALKSQALIQKDENGKWRGWCFLATLGTIANHLEYENNSTADYARSYLNVEEVNKTSETDSVASGSNIISNKAALMQVMNVRGYRNLALRLEIERIAYDIDKGIPMTLFLRRLSTDSIDTQPVLDEGLQGRAGELLGSHSMLLYGYMDNRKDDGTDGDIPSKGWAINPGHLDWNGDIVVTAFDLLGKDSTIELAIPDGKSIYFADFATRFAENKYLREEFKEAAYPQLSMEGTLAYIYNKYEGTNFNYENIFKMLKPVCVTKESETGIVRKSTFEAFKNRNFGKTEQRTQVMHVLRLRGYKTGHLSNPLTTSEYFTDNWCSYSYNKSCDRMVLHMTLGYTPIIIFKVNKGDVILGEYYAAVKEIDKANSDVILTGLYDKQEIIRMPFNCSNFEAETAMGTFTFRPVSVLHVKLEQ